MAGQLRVEREGALGWLIFDQPERRNAVSVEMWEAVPAAARALGADPEVRVVLLRGAGEEAFVSGADISEFEEVRTGERAAEYEKCNAAAFLALATLEKPVIAMIHGFCVGGGLAIALTADLRYSAADGTFAIPAARLGIGYSAGGVEALVGVVGASAAKEILFTGRKLDAGTALRIGLVNGVYPKAELEARVRETAERIASNAPLTVKSVKRICRELARPDTERDGAAMAAVVEACLESDDYREGIRAFLEKRRPVFRGR